MIAASNVGLQPYSASDAHEFNENHANRLENVRANTERGDITQGETSCSSRGNSVAAVSKHDHGHTKVSNLHHDAGSLSAWTLYQANDIGRTDELVVWASRRQQRQQ